MVADQALQLSCSCLAVSIMSDREHKQLIGARKSTKETMMFVILQSRGRRRMVLSRFEFLEILIRGNREIFLFPGFLHEERRK